MASIPEAVVRSFALATLLLASTGCLAETLLGPAAQSTDPVQLTQTEHNLRMALDGATLLNKGQQPIRRYRIGWALVQDGKVSLHEGISMYVDGDVQPQATVHVPDQGVHLDPSVQRYLFYVSEIEYADGSHWNAEALPLITQAKDH